MGSYIVDFASFERKLIIEIDGGQHNEDKLSPSPSLSLQGRGILYKVMQKTMAPGKSCHFLGCPLVFVVAGFIPASGVGTVRAGTRPAPTDWHLDMET
jgi:hypothetical protein